MTLGMAIDMLALGLKGLRFLAVQWSSPLTARGHPSLLAGQPEEWTESLVDSPCPRGEELVLEVKASASLGGGEVLGPVRHFGGVGS